MIAWAPRILPWRALSTPRRRGLFADRQVANRRGAHSECMPDRDHEDYVRDLFERLTQSLGVDLGPAVRHDAEPGRLRVDLVYPVARPRPVAAELTRLTSESWRRARVAVVELAQELHAVAKDDELGHWTLHVAHPIHVRDHRDTLIEALRTGTELSRAMVRTYRLIHP